MMVYRGERRVFRHNFRQDMEIQCVGLSPHHFGLAFFSGAAAPSPPIPCIDAFIVAAPYGYGRMIAQSQHILARFLADVVEQRPSEGYMLHANMKSCHTIIPRLSQRL